MSQDYQAERNRLILAIQQNRAEYARWNREAMHIKQRGSWDDLPRGLRMEMQKDKRVARHPNAPMPQEEYATQLAHAEKMSGLYERQVNTLRRDLERLDARILRNQRVQSALKDRYDRGFDR